MVKQEVINVIQSGAGTYATTSGTDTYTATLSPAPASYTTGMIIRLNFTNANTATATINLNSLGAKGLKKQGGAALAAGDIVASTIYTAVYDGTSFQLDIGSPGQWFDYVPTFGGFSTAPTGYTARYCLVGKTCHVKFYAANGTSNANNFTITVPFTTPTGSAIVFAPGYAVDNGVGLTTVAMFRLTSNINSANVYPSWNPSALWTTSGTKYASFSVTYEIA